MRALRPCHLAIPYSSPSSAAIAKTEKTPIAETMNQRMIRAVMIRDWIGLLGFPCAATGHSVFFVGRMYYHFLEHRTC
jgi:hypothetical protein